MNCFQIEVRGVTFTVWAPTLKDAVETFMIDMDFFEVPRMLCRVAEARVGKTFSHQSVAGFSLFFLTAFESVLLYCWRERQSQTQRRATTFALGVCSGGTDRWRWLS